MLLHGRRAVAAFAMLGLVFIFAGCSDNATGPSSQNPASDESQLTQLVTTDPTYADYFDLDLSYGKPASNPAGAPSLIPLAPIGTLNGWYRDRTAVDHDIEVHIVESVATVTATATITGSLVLNAMEEGGAIVEYRKPLVDVAHRYATFERVGKADGFTNEAWRLVSISNVEFESHVDDAAPTVNIESVTMEPSGMSPVVVSDPATQIERRDILHFNPGQEVVFTITTSGAASLAFLHSGSRSEPKQRIPFEPQPDGTLRAVWMVPNQGGFGHVTVDLLTEGSLYESDPAVAPYDSNQWSFLYRVGEALGGD